MSQIKFPHVSVKLIGEDGNAFSILARVSSAMREAGISEEDITIYANEATSGDYNHLLRVTMKTVKTDAIGKILRYLSTQEKINGGC
jgi:hypothetical protein